jgi:hypothetical protein
MTMHPVAANVGTPMDTVVAVILGEASPSRPQLDGLHGLNARAQHASRPGTGVEPKGLIPDRLTPMDFPCH